jgi:phosphomethylpyrimidine synthase
VPFPSLSCIAAHAPHNRALTDMIATKDSFEPHSSEALPSSQRVYVQGALHPEVRVPMREITLTPTKSFNGQTEANEPVRVYDCSGPWGDPTFKGDVTQGLPGLRRDWILKRGDVEEYAGRPVKPIDDGYLSGQHREHAEARRQDDTAFHLDPAALPKRTILRAKPGRQPTQLAYARDGIITPEMDFIAIR